MTHWLEQLRLCFSHDSDAAYCIGLLMETFSFPAGSIPGEISCNNSNRGRNSEKKEHPEKLHQENIHRRSWSQILIDRRVLAASHQRAFSKGSVTDMKKRRLVQVIGGLGKCLSKCFI